jgi:hypothetical protein
MATPVTQIVGMSALRKDVARLTGDAGPLNAALKAAGVIAAQPVADVTRSTLPQDSGRLAGDVRVSGTKTGASVRMGRASIRYAGWVEFGGHRKVPHASTRQYVPIGRYLFPAALTLATRTAGLYSTAVSVALGNFNWTNSTADAAAVHD